ncbi:phage tail family protein [Paenibacillus larvae]
MITFTNSRGQSINIDKSPFKLIDFDPGRATTNFQTGKSANQDGEIYIDNYLEPRELKIELLIVSKDSKQRLELERTLNQIFNPKLGEGKLVYASAGGQRAIQPVPDGSPIFLSGYDKKTPKVRRISIPLIAHNPYWSDVNPTSRQMSYIMGGYRFSLRLPVAFSKRSFQRGVVNEGDVETPVKIEFKGPAQNPTVYNRTTGEFIRVKRNLSENDILHIDTEFGNKRVEIVRASGTVENAFHFIDLASSFFQLVPGSNTLEYNSNNDSSKTKVIVSYKNRYVGV